MNIQCPCCNGTGELKVDTRRSEIGVIRAELIKAWGVVKRLENMVLSQLDVFTEAIVELIRTRGGARNRIAAQNRQISSLEKLVAIYYGWNSRPSENPERQKAIMEYREESRQYESDMAVAADADEAESDNAGSAETRQQESDVEEAVAADADEADADEAESDNAGSAETRRQFRRREDEYENGAAPKKTGGQPGRKGVARKDKPEEIVRIPASLCKVCGTLPWKVIKTVREMGRDVNRRERRLACVMYVYQVRECGVCGAKCRPDTPLTIPGTSFGPVLRGIIQSYHSAHVSEKDMQILLADLENVDVSVGAISKCVTAIADNVNAPPIRLPYEAPIVIDDDTLREYRSPIKPRACGSSEYDMQEAALTQHSNLWISSMPQPPMVQIIERASMDPWVSTDETTNHIGKEDVFTLAADTLHTTTLRTVRHKDATTLYRIHGWIKNRPAMRDGVTGFEWHMGLLARCAVHINRKSEDFAMKNGIGSPEYTRHTLMKKIYHYLKTASREVERRAGGPIRCASQLGIIHKVPGLAEYIESCKAWLDDHMAMVINSFEHDDFTTTLTNARDNMHTALEVPGMPYQNNGTEGTIRTCVIPERRKYRFLNDRAAYNHSILRSFSATCRKNGISPYQATINMANDARWDIFNNGIPPPIFGGGTTT